MYKLNVLPVKLFGKTKSQNNMLLSHEQCDICKTQGIIFEAIAYKDLFDYNHLRYHSHTYKDYMKLEPATQMWANAFPYYRIFYLCSQECAMMLQLSLGD
jgi:hypothetical protein